MHIYIYISVCVCVTPCNIRCSKTLYLCVLYLSFSLKFTHLFSLVLFSYFPSGYFHCEVKFLGALSNEAKIKLEKCQKLNESDRGAKLSPKAIIYSFDVLFVVFKSQNNNYSPQIFFKNIFTRKDWVMSSET